MSWTYSCPFCGKVVNPDETVILIMERGADQVLIGFHPQPGNYTIYMPPGMELQRGEQWEFYCPLCRANLIAQEHENLCALVCWQGEIRRRVLFSSIVGERATYVVEEKAVHTHGDDSHAYDTKRLRVIKGETIQ
jgi:hypothetical protein